jgi:hypothetical protein
VDARSTARGGWLASRAGTRGERCLRWVDLGPGGRGVAGSLRGVGVQQGLRRSGAGVRLWGLEWSGDAMQERGWSMWSEEAGVRALSYGRWDGPALAGSHFFEKFCARCLLIWAQIGR